ncbi:MAG: phenylalanine--tRNA ligase subunit beta [Phycisphaerales bacterium]
MRTSVTWLNDYLDPPASAEEQAALLTRAGLPFDGREEVDGDIRQEIETTSNRGDCLCHVGMAREVAAMSGRSLRMPVASPAATGPDVATVASVRNDEPSRCPLYTARVILGAQVRPSPPWLAARLRAIGQIPRNNIVDATNFVLFELGQPTHVFDLDTLHGRRIVVRLARPQEPFLPIGEGASEVRLSPDDLVIADAERAVAIAGVKGGALTAVRDTTTNLLLEAATFDPVAVRRTSQRLRIASDSSYRFERGVHPAQVDPAADRLAALILEVAGGTLCAGVLRSGAPMPAPRTIALRVARCRRILGVDVPVESMTRSLATLGFAPRLVTSSPSRHGRGPSQGVAASAGGAAGGAGDTIECTVPPTRMDIEREIDLIEEVARMAGQDAIPIAETIAVRVAPAQPRIQARRAIRDALAGLGFVEAVTHSLIGEGAAAPFVRAGAAALRVDDERAKSEPILRPSIVPSLLRVRRHNLDHGVHPLDLFEMAGVFHQRGEAHHESESLALAMDERSRDTGLRALRGVVERVLRLVAGERANVDLRLADAPSWLSPASEIVLRNPGGAAAPSGAPPAATVERVVGRMGRVAPSALRVFGLEAPILVAEIDLDGLLDRYPPEVAAQPLPAFPSIDRDVSAIVDERVAWRDVAAVVDGLSLALLEEVQFVTVFRGAPIRAGAKSVTLRLRFRSGERTLRHEEVDPQVELAKQALGARLGAEVRS